MHFLTATYKSMVNISSMLCSMTGIEDSLKTITHIRSGETEKAKKSAIRATTRLFTTAILVTGVYWAKTQFATNNLGLEQCLEKNGFRNFDYWKENGVIDAVVDNFPTNKKYDADTLSNIYTNIIYAIKEGTGQCNSALNTVFMMNLNSLLKTCMPEAYNELL